MIKTGDGMLISHLRMVKDLQFSKRWKVSDKLIVKDWSNDYGAPSVKYLVINLEFCIIPYTF